MMTHLLALDLDSIPDLADLCRATAGAFVEAGNCVLYTPRNPEINEGCGPATLCVASTEHPQEAARVIARLLNACREVFNEKGEAN